MKKKIVCLYSFNELNDTAKQRAIENKRERMDAWDATYDDIHALEQIAKDVFNAKLKYEFSFCSPSWVEIQCEKQDLQGIRALKYVFNNYLLPFYDFPIMYSKDWKKSRKVKSRKTFGDVTGYYLDSYIKTAYKDFCDKVRKDKSTDVEDFFQILEEYFAKAIMDSVESYISDENIAEMLMDSDEEIYMEDGEIY